jgi:hypothetical protein
MVLMPPRACHLNYAKTFASAVWTGILHFETYSTTLIDASAMRKAFMEILSVPEPENSARIVDMAGHVIYLIGKCVIRTEQAS